MKESVAAIHFGFIKRRATCPELDVVQSWCVYAVLLQSEKVLEMHLMEMQVKWIPKFRDSELSK